MYLARECIPGSKSVFIQMSKSIRQDDPMIVYGARLEAGNHLQIKTVSFGGSSMMCVYSGMDRATGSLSIVLCLM